MKSKEIIRAPKTDISFSEWKSGKISRNSFPLSKAKARGYKYGPDYQWCVGKFAALGHDFRVLILCRLGREIYYATLGLFDGRDTTVLCSYEFHGSEVGWHCHGTCEDHTKIPSGTFRPRQLRRFPNGNNPHRRNDFRVRDVAEAKKVAVEFYNIEEKGSLL